MSCGLDRRNVVDFIYVIADFKIRPPLTRRSRLQSGGRAMIGRRRRSSVPFTAVVAALAAIAVMALLAFYIGDGALLDRFLADPTSGSAPGGQ